MVLLFNFHCKRALVLVSAVVLLQHLSLELACVLARLGWQGCAQHSIVCILQVLVSMATTGLNHTLG